MKLLLLCLVALSSSCSLLPTSELRAVEYCVRQPGTNMCRDYYEQPYDACGIYDDPYCVVRRGY